MDTEIQEILRRIKKQADARPTIAFKCGTRNGKDVYFRVPTWKCKPYPKIVRLTAWEKTKRSIMRIFDKTNHNPLDFGLFRLTRKRWYSR